jgi:hypothetical protein
VESGADVADHIKPNAGTVTIEAEVTNAPLTAPPSQADGVAARFQAAQIVVAGRQVSVTTLQFSQAFDRRRTVDGVMRDLIQARTLVRIVTALREYEDMAITRFSTESTAASAHSLPVVLEAERVRVVSAQRVSVPDPVERRGRTRRDRGGENPTPARETSTAAQLRDAIGERLRGLL